MKQFQITVTINDEKLEREIVLLRTVKNSLKECAEELDISYQQDADISVNRWRQKSKYRFTPDIQINKISSILNAE